MRNIPGDHNEKATPGPIPNPEVKLFGADDTALATEWESRSSPGFLFFLTQHSWIRALDSKFKICSKKLTNFRICYKALTNIHIFTKKTKNHFIFP
jgi:hypothetical protein